MTGRGVGRRTGWVVVALLGAVGTAAAQDGGEPRALPWRPTPTVRPEAVRAAEDALGLRWRSPDGRWTIRPPKEWTEEAAGTPGGAPPGELGRFVAPSGPGLAGTTLRVGYVDGPVAGSPEEMELVMHNVANRLGLQGLTVLPSRPISMTVSGHAAVWSEAQLAPASGVGPVRTNVYAYIHHGERPGILVQGVVPGVLTEDGRALLWACVQSLTFHDPPLPRSSGQKGPPVWLFAPVLLAGLLLAATAWMKRRY